MNKHTPEPWTLESCDGCNATGKDRHRSRIRHGGTSFEIVQRVGGTTYPTLRANARLIAAAPKLLACVQVWLEQMRQDMAPEDSAQFMMAQESIAQATSMNLSTCKDCGGDLVDSPTFTAMNGFCGACASVSFGRK